MSLVAILAVLIYMVTQRASIVVVTAMVILLGVRLLESSQVIVVGHLT